MAQDDTSELQIPVIDISTENVNAAGQLLDAAYRFGFVFVANNRAWIEPSLIEKMFALSKQFFALPVNVKDRSSISSNKAGKNHGWLSRGVEKLDPATQKKADVKEHVDNQAFNLGQPVNGKFEQPMPDLLHQHIDTVLAFQEACHELCQHILELFAVALGIDDAWFTSRHDHAKGPSGTVLRMLFYPQTDNKDDTVDIRAGAHSDYGSVTCLFQLPGQPGLEIKTPSGRWAAVPVDPEAPTNADDADESPRRLPILVNIGDLLEDWTGGLLKSTIHRVVFPTEEAGDRYSLAYFCHPLDDALLEPVPSKLVRDHTAKHPSQRQNVQGGKVITAKDHLMERLAATYNVK